MTKYSQIAMIDILTPRSIEYYQKLRKFKNGAFSFAVRNNVPVIPYVFKFEKVTGKPYRT